jgi:hypothetical protein
VQEILKDEWLTCGIIVFDSWILNEDRTNKNIVYDDLTQQVQLIDHGRAFYDHCCPQYLKTVQNSICFDSTNHVLAEQVRTLQHFDEWHERIRLLPEYFIRDSLAQATNFGLPPDQIEYCLAFLMDRRERLKEIFKNNYKDAFPNLNDGLLNPFLDPETV